MLNRSRVLNVTRTSRIQTKVQQGVVHGGDCTSAYRWLVLFRKGRKLIPAQCHGCMVVLGEKVKVPLFGISHGWKGKELGRISAEEMVDKMVSFPVRSGYFSEIRVQFVRKKVAMAGYTPRVLGRSGV